LKPAFKEAKRDMLSVGRLNGNWTRFCRVMMVCTCTW